MRNLAGKGQEAAIACGDELKEAGIPYAAVIADGEVQSQLGGVIKIGGYEIMLIRRWVYWSASVHKNPHDGFGLPADLAKALNDAPYEGPFSYYAGPAPRLGSVVRADGYAGGQRTEEVGPTALWHIDTQGGLNAFAKWCYKNLGGGSTK